MPKDPKITVTVSLALLNALMEADQALASSRRPKAKTARADLASLTVACGVARSKIPLVPLEAPPDGPTAQ